MNSAANYVQEINQLSDNYYNKDLINTIIEHSIESLGPNLSIYEALLRFYERYEDWNNIITTIEQMADYGLDVDSFTYALLIKAYLYLGMVDKGWATIDALEQINLDVIKRISQRRKRNPKFSVTSYDLSPLYTPMIYHYLSLKDFEAVNKILTEMKNKNVLLEIPVYQTLMRDYLLYNQMDDATKLFFDMLPYGNEIEANTYLRYVHALLDRGEINQAINAINLLRERQVVLGNRIYAKLITKLMELGQIEISENVYYMAQDEDHLNYRIFEAMIEGYLSNHLIDKANQFVKQLHKQDMIDHAQMIYYQTYISSYSNGSNSF